MDVYDNTIMISNNLSKTISLLRGPVALLVICVHADFTKDFSYNGKKVICANDIGYHIVNFISHSFTDFAVPLFYIISGVLYYSSIKKYSYKELIKKKMDTLFVPYVLWNIIFFVAFFLHKDYSIIEFLKGIWNIPGKEKLIGGLTQPWDGPLWFLRDLIVVFLLTPLIVFSIRKIGIVYILILLFLYITKVISWYIIPGISITSLLMFSIGVYLQYIGVDWLAKIRHYKVLLILLFLFSAIATYIYLIRGDNFSVLFNIFHALAIFSGIGAAFAIASIYVMKFTPWEGIGKYSFVIFACHTLFLTYLIKIVMLPFGYEIVHWQILFIYITSVMLTYFISYLVGFVINKNKFLRKLLAGNR